MPLFKSVYDIALFPMLIHEIRPATIIEIGSGEGTSAIWFADLLLNSAVEAMVYSFDLYPPRVEHPRVEFKSGDSRRPHTTWPTQWLKALPHPWLVVDDAHQNLDGVLAHFGRHFVEGDYLVVEDCAEGQARRLLKEWLHDCGDGCKVDAKYVDFFGENLTGAPDAFIRITGALAGVHV